MKYIFILLLQITISCNKKTDLEILNQTISKINNLDAIEYNSEFEFRDVNSGETGLSEANVYFDLTSNDTILGAKYIINNPNAGVIIFNGKEVFQEDVEERVFVKYTEDLEYNVNSSFFTLNSLAALKMFLSRNLENKVITGLKKKDTIINSIPVYNLDIKIPFTLKEIERVKKGFPELSDINHSYSLAIDKKTFLPIQFIYFELDGSYRKDTYHNLNNVEVLSDKVFDSIVFTKEYPIVNSIKYWNNKLGRHKEELTGIKMKDWSLYSLEEEKVQLSKINSKLTLLEFSFPGCGGCVSAIPHLNEIQKKYKSKGLTLLAIDNVNTKKDYLREYVKNKNIQLQTLYDGKEIAKNYDALGAPTFFLLDQNLKIVYTEIGLEKEELIKAIEENL